MRLRVVPALLSIALFSGMLVADEHSVTFDDHAEFSKLRTFAIREARSNSAQYEIDNPLYIKTIADTIREVLAAKGLKETTDRPDLFVDFRIVGTQTSTADRPNERIRGGVLFIKGTITVDLVRREPALLVWEGIYHDDESNGSKLARQLPGDVKKLFEKFPPK